METDQQSLSTAAGFPQTVSAALALLNQQLQNDYDEAYPQLREIIHLVLDEEESNAWNLTAFPHLLLPDLVEAHVAKLNLRPAKTKHDDVFEPHGFGKIDNYAPIFAFAS